MASALLVATRTLLSFSHLLSGRMRMATSSLKNLCVHLSSDILSSSTAYVATRDPWEFGVLGEAVPRLADLLRHLAAFVEAQGHGAAQGHGCYFHGGHTGRMAPHRTLGYLPSDSQSSICLCFIDFLSGQVPLRAPTASLCCSEYSSGSLFIFYKVLSLFFYSFMLTFSL